MKTLSVELRSRIDMLVVMTAIPSLIFYLFWSAVSRIDVIRSGSSKLIPVKYYNEYLDEILSKTDFFANVQQAQFVALDSALTRILLASFLAGVLLSSLFIADPLASGQIIIDTSLTRSKIRAVSRRLLIILYYGAFLALMNAFTAYTSTNFGISLPLRALISVSFSSFMSFAWGTFLVLLLAVLFRNQVYPLAVGFIIAGISFSNSVVKDLLFPFKSIMYILWNSEFGNLSRYSWLGLVIALATPVLSLKILERREVY